MSAQNIQYVKLLGTDKVLIIGIKSMNFESEIYSLHGIKNFSDGYFSIYSGSCTRLIVINCSEFI